MLAQPISNAIIPKAVHTLPNGVGAIVISYDGSYQEFKEAPNALEMGSRIYGKSGHNSDTLEIIYRTDCKAAFGTIFHMGR